MHVGISNKSNEFVLEEGGEFLVKLKVSFL